ncbi:hypothetical protein POM88_035380 [Heracleum sosnowskyi]|uniref:Uncharacterized protein n=1 Tax=Heracleum sosnowskyi TaxID=360622 RepID=A0AAD8MEN0_9APIA|nr:hypothetical protein POM88_035380 [Heracleum sosnowskyi]
MWLGGGALWHGPTATIIKNFQHWFLVDTREMQKFLATPGSPSGWVEERPENDLETVELMIRWGRSDSFDRKNDHDDNPVIYRTDNVEENSFTNAQLLNRSRKINNFENERDVTDELVLNRLEN